MNLLQINSSDTLGSRFNGLSISDLLETQGIHSRHLVWRQHSQHPRVELAFNVPLRRHVAWGIDRLETMLSVQSMLHLQWFALPLNARFRAADVVHYHIIHDGYFSLAALPMLSRLRPTVWTFHDPWAMTGHCFHPLECTRWQTGCGGCPDLNMTVPLRHDRTRLNWRYKQLTYRHSDIDVVVASKWMRDFAAKSPLTQGFRFHQIPFGLDLQRFSPGSKEAARERLGIFPNQTVIALRAFEGPIKGMEYLKQALRRLNTDKPICILTTNEKGNFDEFIGKFQIVEVGWTTDEDLMVAYYRAADFFVMPSMAESFGLMAVEAMACGRPTISFEGTSLPDVTFAPDAGLAVRSRDIDGLAAAITHWVEHPDEVSKRGRRSRELAEANYGVDRYVQRLAALYRDAAERWKSKKAA